MGDLEVLKQKIVTYQLEGTTFGNLGYKHIFLQICGPAGHGKSSLINSFKYAFYGGRFSVSAPVAPAHMSQGGYTMVRLSYELTEVITLVDNRGLGKMDSYEKEEVYAQLANLQPVNEEVKWGCSYETRMEGVTSAERNTNDLLVPIFVWSMEAPIAHSEKAEMMDFFKTAQKITGFLPIIVLTKRLSANARQVRLQFEEMNTENTFEVENYTEEDHMKSLGKDKTFLTILSTVLDLVDFAAKNVVPTLDTPEKEHQKRVQMLLKMAHDNDVEKERKTWMAEAEQEQKQPKKKGGCDLL